MRREIGGVDQQLRDHLRYQCRHVEPRWSLERGDQCLDVASMLYAFPKESLLDRKGGEECQKRLGGFGQGQGQESSSHWYAGS